MGADVTGLPILSVMTWAPFIAALIVMAFARHRPLLVRWTSLLGATVSLVASLWVFWSYDRAAAGFQFQEQFDLVPSLGISYLFAIDGMSALMCLLTSIIIFAGVFASWTVKERSQEFYALLLLLVTGVYGVFVSLDLFVFFLFYEIAVLPMYLLIGIWGSSGEVRPQGIFGWAFGRTGVGTKEYAAMKLTLYLLFGSAFILVGILALYVAGGRSFSFLTLQSMQFDPTVQSWVFLAFYIGFGILAGIWPLHTWSPDGHASAPTAVSMLHAGVLMKLGAYGVVRLGMGLLPDATVEWAWLVGGIACINIVYGALSAMAQTDLKYVIAYSSVSHMGVVMLGAATLTVTGLNGSVFQMFAHGIMTGLFFALVGLVYEKAHSREIFKMGGFGVDDARHRHGVYDRRPLVARAAGHRGLRRRVPHLPRRVDLELFVVALPGRARRVPDINLRAPRREADLPGKEERRPALPASAGRAGHRMGGAGDSGVRARAVRRRTGAGAEARGYGDRAASTARRAVC